MKTLIIPTDWRANIKKLDTKYQMNILITNSLKVAELDYDFAKNSEEKRLAELQLNRLKKIQELCNTL